MMDSEPKKQQVDYFDSSESEGARTDKEEGKKICKKGH